MIKDANIDQTLSMKLGEKWQFNVKCTAKPHLSGPHLSGPHLSGLFTYSDDSLFQIHIREPIMIVYIESD